MSTPRLEVDGVRLLECTVNQIPYNLTEPGVVFDTSFALTLFCNHQRRLTLEAYTTVSLIDVVLSGSPLLPLPVLHKVQRVLNPFRC